jgi:hypothetical protein
MTVDFSVYRSTVSRGEPYTAKFTLINEEQFIVRCALFKHVEYCSFAPMFVSDEGVKTPHLSEASSQVWGLIRKDGGGSWYIDSSVECDNELRQVINKCQGLAKSLLPIELRDYQSKPFKYDIELVLLPVRGGEDE